LVRMFRRLRPDIVHTHNPKPGVYGRLAARVAGVPVVVNTVHGLYATPTDPPLRRTLVYALERGVSMCSQAELIQNEEDLETLARLRVPARKLVLLGNGVDIERFRPRPELAEAARRSMGVADGKVLVGLVGRLVWEKGFAELFEAAERLRHTNPEVAIVVVGPGDPAKSNALSEEDVRAAEAIGNVSFLGERKDVEDLYPGMDLFVLPSYREGFPRSAMEATACGVPVVATDIRGCRQVVDHGTTGLLVPVRDPSALAEALATLARDPARRRSMSEAAVTRAGAEFDDRRVIRITLDAYERLLVRAGKSRRRSPSAG
jgi:glycosyltransferase involved in cell wall biosynthesis